MPRKTKKDALAARQDVSAPFLFDEESLPHRPDLVRAVVEKRYETTGARLLDNDDKVMRLVDLLLRHPPIGLRKIARAIGCSRDSVRAAKDALVSQGKLGPYKERVLRIHEDIIEFGSGNYLRALENDAVPISTIPLGVGIFSDKRALGLGEPTAISLGATAQLRPESLSVAKLNAFLDGLPTESISAGNAENPQQKEGEPAIDATLDATLPPPASPEATPNAVETGPPTDQSSQPTDGGGGGSKAGGG